MSRNRLRNSHSLSAWEVSKWLAVMVIAAGLGIGYLVMKNQIAHIAEETRKLEAQTREVTQRNKRRMEQIADLKAPEKLRKRIEGMRLVNVSELQSIDMRDRVGLSNGPQPVSARLARTGNGNSSTSARR